MDEWDKYQEEMKFKYPKVFENALKIQSLYPETDRGAALIVAAVLEEQLTLILYSFLRDSKSAKIDFDTQQIKDLINGNLIELPPNSSTRKLFHNWFINLNHDLLYRSNEVLTDKRNSKTYKFKQIKNINFVEVDGF